MNNLLRSLGLFLLLLGISAVGFWFPSQPSDSWDFIHAFEFGAEACRDLRQSRETTEFKYLEPVEQTTTVGEVARRHNLELSLVCQVNELPRDCRNHQVSNGETLILPLGRRQSDLPIPKSTAEADE